MDTISPSKQPFAENVVKMCLQIKVKKINSARTDYGR